MNQDYRMRVHQALASGLDDGEMVVNWVAVIEIVGPDDTHYLAHRSGGGLDGTDPPMVWTAIGLLHSSIRLAEEHLLDQTAFLEDGDEDDGEDTDASDEDSGQPEEG